MRVLISMRYYGWGLFDKEKYEQSYKSKTRGITVEELKESVKKFLEENK